MYAASGDVIFNADFYLFIGQSFGNGLSSTISKHEILDLTVTQSTHHSDGTNIATPNNFIQMIVWQDYVFFFIQRDKTEGSAHIGRLCRNSADSHFESYTEIEFCCKQGQNNYTEIRAASIGLPGSELATSLGIRSSEDVLFAAFTEEGTQSSALCIYTMKDIQQEFAYAVYGCITGNSSLGVENAYLIADAECGKVGKS